MEEGLAAYLGAQAVRHAEMRCGQKLWPIIFSYLREEGPYYLEEWVQEEPDESARRYAGMLLAVDEAASRDRSASVLKSLFQEPAAVRDLVKRFEQGVSALDGVQMPAGIFPADFVDPPFLWLFPEPDLSSLETYRGLKAKRYKSEILLQYDDNKSERMQALGDGFTIMFYTPPGKWKISSLRMYGYRVEGEGEGAALTLALKDAAFAPLGEIRISLDGIKTKRPAWQDLGGFGDVMVSGPLLITVKADESCRGALMVGCDEGGGGGHSFRLVPGSHGEPPGGSHDWMFRLFLTGEREMDRSELDAVVKEFRKTVSER
jgi:hypothetical protein